MARRHSDGGDFLRRIARCLPPLCLIEGTAHPRRNGQSLAIGEPSNLGKFPVREENLKPFTHAMSIV